MLLAIFVAACLQKHSCDIYIEYAKSYTELDANIIYCFYRTYNSTEENLVSNTDFVLRVQLCFRRFPIDGFSRK